MRKDLTPSTQKSTLVLSKAKNLLNITNKILENRNSDLVNGSWMNRIWEWADINYIAEYHYNQFSEHYTGLPRNKQQLLFMKELVLFQTDQATINSGGMSSIYKLPIEIGNLINLKSMILDDINLKEVPASIVKLQNLEELKLGWNPHVDMCHGYENSIESLPNDIGKLKSLKKLYLDMNPLEKLPNSMCNLYNLEILSLYACGICELPLNIGLLNNLKELNLWWNDLVVLPRSIVKLTNLKKLTLRDNPNIMLTEEQKKWIQTLKKNDCFVWIDDNLF